MAQVMSGGRSRKAVGSRPAGAGAPVMVAWTLVLLCFGTNYLNYSAIDGAMTHNNVFTIYALLLLTTHRFYVRATWSRALLIGACIGLMALTRPTEIIAALIPVLWGLELTRKGAIGDRLALFGQHWGKLLAAAGVTLLIGSVHPGCHPDLNGFVRDSCCASR